MKTYKEDGARSYQRFFINKYLTDVLCRRDNTRFVKPKWKLGINKIESIRDNYHENPKLYASSAFENISWFAKARNRLVKKGNVMLF